MASGSRLDDAVPSPDRQTQEPPPNAHTDMWTVRKFGALEVEITKHGLILDAIAREQKAQSDKLDRLLDRVAEMKDASTVTTTKLDRAITDIAKLDERLDKVRTLVIGAAAVVTVLGFIAPALIGRWLSAPQPAPSAVSAPPPAAPTPGPAPGRRNG